MEPTSLPEEAVCMTDRPDDHDEHLVHRRFTVAGQDPFRTVEWGVREAWTRDSPYYMKIVEAPISWSQQAVDITAKLYLSKGAEPETSVRQLVHRVVNKITAEGMRAGYFGWPAEVVERLGCEIVDVSLLSDDDEARVFYDELVYVCLHQMATFNSPVWFNIGRDDRPQAPSACYILNVEDNTESIMRWARDEAFIFKAGAGSGVNVSDIRASIEELSAGGVASGPVSFMRVPNAVAETIKSGGTTRRAARIVQLDVDHPDIVDFIRCKPREEERLRIIAAAGLDVGMGEEGERNVAEMTSYQSANNSVRVTDEFMNAAEHHGSFVLRPRKNSDQIFVSASDILDEMAAAAHVCADPGIMFDDTINSWNTTPSAGRIRSTNPCGELHTPDNSSCNLGALNVARFLDDDGSVRVTDVRHVVDVMTTAMDVLVEFCELPTDVLTQRTKRYRWLGLGMTNLGAAIMSKGLAYDSHEGRDFAASVMALITGRCYLQSTKLAEKMGPFADYDGNREPMLGVIRKHRDCLPHPDTIMSILWSSASTAWDEVEHRGRLHGFRNAQASVIAPNGTTSFFLGCDTTGIEPSFSLVQYKDLSGGGSMVLVNGFVGRALKSLGHDETEIEAMLVTLHRKGVDEFMLDVEPEHQEVFHGANDISADGHVKMLAAVQPWLSGAASKTINLPHHATPADIRECFIMAWKLGVKCIAVYRDGSKARQVLSTSESKKDGDGGEEFKDELVRVEDALLRARLMVPPATNLPGVSSRTPTSWESDASDPVTDLKAVLGDELGVAVAKPLVTPKRRRLPRTRRNGITHKIHIRSSLGEQEGYVGASTYDDGTLGEVFMEGFGRMGGFVQNVLSAWSTDFSIALQYGVPFEVLVRKHVGHSDETGGVVVPDPAGEPLVVRSCDSIVDYIARWLVSEFGDVDLQEELGVMTDAVKARKTAQLDAMTLAVPDGVEAGVFTSSGGFVARQGGAIELSGIDLAPVGTNERRVQVAALLASSNGHAKESTVSAQACPSCRAPMQRTGTCMMCSQCGHQSGGC